jgi:hypothetical protein
MHSEDAVDAEKAGTTQLRKQPAQAHTEPQQAAINTGHCQWASVTYPKSGLSKLVGMEPEIKLFAKYLPQRVLADVCSERFRAAPENSQRS